MKYEVIEYTNGGYDEEMIEVFEVFEDAENYCKGIANNYGDENDEGLFIRCYENGKVFDEPWD